MKTYKYGETRVVRVRSGPQSYADNESVTFVDYPHWIDQEQKLLRSGYWDAGRHHIATVERIPRWWERLLFWRKPQVPRATVIRQ